MSSKQAQGRRKFNVSLAELCRPEKQIEQYKTYKPPDMAPKAASESHSEELTPQQEARKRYEERNLVQRRKRARERMAKRRAENREKERELQKAHEEIYRRRHREERRFQEDRRRSLRYIEQYGAKSFHLYMRRRNGHLQRPEDYEETV
ncbi:hypothetical protein EV360DRAFT_90909 [Lentinula raphanica]|nr:hypothetical protein EV360DRAFT_90909 [Lentinula raphanica]